MTRPDSKRPARGKSKSAGAGSRRPKPGKPRKPITAAPPKAAALKAAVAKEQPEPLPPIPPLPPLGFGETFTVPETVARQTVLAVLRALRPGESWSKLRGQMQRGHVSLNGVVCVDEARRVAVGDQLTLNDRPRALPPRVADVVIEYVDPHVVVVQKPAGMMTHRRPEERNWSAERKSRQPALDEALNEMLTRRGAGADRGRQRTGLVRCVHRLDRDTSGLLVFARNEAAEEHLVSQFRRHTAHRVYWAIVHGRPQDGTIVSNLARDRGDGRRGSVQNTRIGQRAVTHVRCLEQFGDYSLVECRLETGRTNQIRIHLAESGHMVCGDPKYDQPYGAEGQRDTSQAPRLALHAAELGFIHPVSGQELIFQMPFPPDLQQFITQLRVQGKRRPG